MTTPIPPLSASPGRPPVAAPIPGLQRPPSLRAVVAFEAAARYENFARAAAELSLSQSAISHAIRGLEDRIGELLFERNGRRVSLTPQGAQIAQRIRASLALLAGAFETPGPRTEASRVVIAAPREFAAEVLLPRLVAGDLIDSCEVHTNRSIEALDDGAADLVIARGARASRTFSSQPLGRETVFPVAAPSIMRLGGYPSLECLPVIENLACPWRVWLARLHRDDSLPGLGLVVDDWSLAIDAARAGAGVCLARSSLVAGDLAEGRLVRVGRGELIQDDGYQLIWDPRARRRTAVSAVIAWLSADHGVSDPTPSDARAAQPQRG